MKRKAPSQDAMRKALATFKRKHPGKPIPGFLRKYAGGAARVNPIKRVGKKRIASDSAASFRPKRVARVQPRVRRKTNVRMLHRKQKMSPMRYIVETSRDGKTWNDPSYARTPEIAKRMARAMGAYGYHARVRYVK